MNFKSTFLGIFLSSFLLLSCNDTSEDVPRGAYENGVLIMNEGSFGANDGEVYHLDRDTQVLNPSIFEAENSRPFAGLLEDMVLDGERMYLVANTGKVEIVNAGNFKSIGAVSGDLDIPRSLAVAGGKLFISDYGPYDENFNTPNSFVAVVANSDGGPVTKKIPVSNKPEGLFAFSNLVLVAGAEEGKIEVIEIQSEEVIQTITVEGSPYQFFFNNDQLVLYVISTDKVSFYQINLVDLSFSSRVDVEVSNATSRIAKGGIDQYFVLTSTGFPDYNDVVVEINLNSGISPTAEEVFSGNGLYGIGFDPITEEIYIANANGFQGNGTVLVLDKEGNENRNFIVGRAPSGFLFY